MTKLRFNGWIFLKMESESKATANKRVENAVRYLQSEFPNLEVSKSGVEFDETLEEYLNRTKKEELS